MDDPYEENSQQRQRITQPKPHDHVKCKGKQDLINVLYTCVDLV